MIPILLMTFGDKEQDRIRTLWQECGTALVRLAEKELGSAARQDAEDIVGDAFERLMVRYERYAGLKDEQMKSLLLRTVKNLCVDAYRRGKHESYVPDPPDGEDGEDFPADPRQPTPEEYVVSEDNIRRMKEIIRSLSPVLRDALEMKLIEDMTNREIAEELGVPESVVRQRISRARKTVRSRWEEEENG